MGLSETLKAISAPIRRQILDSLKSGPKSAGDRLRKKAAAVNPDRMALTGQVDSSLRIGGHPVEMDTIWERQRHWMYISAISGKR
jgi:DNA-binding transcriptional ArsR family regulator